MYVNLAAPPAAMSTVVLSTALLMPHVKIRPNEVLAVLLTVRFSPTHTLTDCFADPVVDVVFVVNVAVLS